MQGTDMLSSRTPDSLEDKAIFSIMKRRKDTESSPGGGDGGLGEQCVGVAYRADVSLSPKIKNLMSLIKRCRQECMSLIG